MGRLLKKCNDGRFLRAEERLFCALGHFLKRDRIASITVSELADKAKIWGSTFYDHFKNVDDALIKYNHRYDLAIERLRDEAINEQVNTELVFSRILYFINKHKNYYSICLYRQNLVPFFTIAKIFRPVLACSWSNYGREKFDLCFKMFCGEMFGVVSFWGVSENFDTTKIKDHAEFLAHLTKNATRRLF